MFIPNAVKSNLKKYTRLFSKNKEAMMLVDGGNMSLLMVNDAFAKLFKYDKSKEIIATRMHPNHFFPLKQPKGALSAELIEQKIRECLKNSQGTVDFDWDFLDKEGSAILTHVWLSMVIMEGKAKVQFVVKKQAGDYMNVDEKLIRAHIVSGEVKAQPLLSTTASTPEKLTESYVGGGTSSEFSASAEEPTGPAYSESSTNLQQAQSHIQVETSSSSDSSAHENLKKSKTKKAKKEKVVGRVSSRTNSGDFKPVKDTSPVVSPSGSLTGALPPVSHLSIGSVPLDFEIPGAETASFQSFDASAIDTQPAVGGNNGQPLLPTFDPHEGILGKDAEFLLTWARLRSYAAPIGTKQYDLMNEMVEAMDEIRVTFLALLAKQRESFQNQRLLLEQDRRNHYSKFLDTMESGFEYVIGRSISRENKVRKASVYDEALSTCHQDEGFLLPTHSDPLLAMLDNPFKTHEFLKYLALERSNEENLLFYLDIAQYEKLNSQTEMIKLAKSMITDYLELGCPKEVNISDRLRSEVKVHASTAIQNHEMTPNIFAVVKNDLLREIRFGPFQEFLKKEEVQGIST